MRGAPPHRAIGHRAVDDGAAARALAGRADAAAILALQRLAGNRAVTGLVAQRWGIGDVLSGIGDALSAGAAAAGKALTPTLKIGDKGPSVKALQEALNKRGAALIADGRFGKMTKAGVSAIQRDHGLTVNGIADYDTQVAIGKGGKSIGSDAPGMGATKSWKSMSAEERKDWETLGYTAATWASKTPPFITFLPFSLLPEAQRVAATRLGFTPESWKYDRDATAASAKAAYADEEKVAKQKAGPGVLPAKYVGSLRAKAMLTAEYGDYSQMALPNVHLLSEAEMKTTWEGIYGAGTYKPVNGFTVKPDIYLNKKSVWAGTSVHESLHIQEHTLWDAFAYKGNTAFGEGATTILTEKAMKTHGYAVEPKYPTQVSLVTKMNTHAGLPKMKAAYFKGETAPYQAAVTAGLVAGTSWAQFRALVDAGTLAAAEAKLK